VPEQVWLPDLGQRRVPGLRREEVAALAGVSADYYRRLERGQLGGASALVLEAVADALQLDDAELEADGLGLAIYTAMDPASQQALDLLASWSATPHRST
jgi:transcriptional regulator with XRE-family HTH domain